MGGMLRFLANRQELEVKDLVGERTAERRVREGEKERWVAACTALQLMISMTCCCSTEMGIKTPKKCNR